MDSSWQGETSLTFLIHLLLACLLHINDAKNKSGQGVAQGDPTSGDCFSVILQPSLVRLDSDCREGGGMARAGHDDIMAIGLKDVVLAAVQRFADEVWERFRLRLDGGG